MSRTVNQIFYEDSEDNFNNMIGNPPTFDGNQQSFENTMNQEGHQQSLNQKFQRLSRSEAANQSNSYRSSPNSQKDSLPENQTPQEQTMDATQNPQSVSEEGTPKSYPVNEKRNSYKPVVAKAEIAFQECFGTKFVEDVKLNQARLIRIFDEAANYNFNIFRKKFIELALEDNEESMAKQNTNIPEKKRRYLGYRIEFFDLAMKSIKEFSANKTRAGKTWISRRTDARN